MPAQSKGAGIPPDRFVSCSLSDDYIESSGFFLGDFYLEPEILSHMRNAARASLCSTILEWINDVISPYQSSACKPGSTSFLVVLRASRTILFPSDLQC